MRSTPRSRSRSVVLLVGVAVIVLLLSLPVVGRAEQLALTVDEVGMMDADVYEYSYRNWNNANVGANGGMALGTHLSGLSGTRRRIYIQFDVQALHRRVGMPEFVGLQLTYNLSESQRGEVNVYRVTEPWNEGDGLYHSGQVEPNSPPGTISWNRQPRFDTGRVWSRHTFTPAKTHPARATIDITELALGWIGNRVPNHGLVLVAADEAGDRFKVDVQSSESSRVDLRPRLVVDVAGGGGGRVDDPGEPGQLTVTYCDGNTQVVQLQQPTSRIESLEFDCSDPCGGSVPGGGSDPGGFGGTTYIPDGLKGDIYYLPQGTGSLPNLDAMTPVGTIYARHLNVPSQPFDRGFPGVTDRFEWFAISYRGTFQISTGGTHGFRMVSDDGSRLYVDDRLVIDNDGVHPPRSMSGKIDLSPGTHSIRVDYFQGPRTMVALQLFMTPPGGSEAIF